MKESQQNERRYELFEADETLDIDQMKLTGTPYLSSLIWISSVSNSVELIYEISYNIAKEETRSHQNMNEPMPRLLNPCVSSSFRRRHTSQGMYSGFTEMFKIISKMNNANANVNRPSNMTSAVLGKSMNCILDPKSKRTVAKIITVFQKELRTVLEHNCFHRPRG
jgi:hypothetical protein